MTVQNDNLGTICTNNYIASDTSVFKHADHLEKPIIECKIPIRHSVLPLERCRLTHGSLG